MFKTNLDKVWVVLIMDFIRLLEIFYFKGLLKFSEEKSSNWRIPEEFLYFGGFPNFLGGILPNERIPED